MPGTSYLPKKIALIIVFILSTIFSSLAQAEDKLIEIPDLGIQLMLPEGWSVQKIWPGRGAQIGPSGGAVQIEVVLWEPISQIINPRLGASAHEDILKSRLDYKRIGQKTFTTANGLESIVVTGEVPGESGQTDCIFAAYVFGKQYFILGASAKHGELPGIQTAFFNLAAVTFTPLGTRIIADTKALLARIVPPEPVKPEPVKPEPVKPIPPKPEPVKPEPVKPEPVKPEPVKPEPVKPEPVKPEPVKPEPVKPEPIKPEPIKPEPIKPEPIKPEPVKPEPVKPEPVKPEPVKPEPIKPEPIKPEPVKPEPVKPEPVKPIPPKPEPVKPEPVKPIPPKNEINRDFVQWADPLGFEMIIPAGWSPRVENNCIWLWPAEGNRFGISVWPLLPNGEKSIPERSRQAIERWAQLLGSTWRSGKSRVKADNNGQIIVNTGEITYNGIVLQAVSIFTAGEGTDLLQVMLWHPGALDADRRTLAEVAGSFKASSFRIISQQQDAIPWSDAEGAIELQAPGGWTLEGTVNIYNQIPAISITGTRDIDGARFTWQQPQTPGYKDLTPALLAVGWKAGDEFAPERGVDPLELRKRVTASEACRLALSADDLTLGRLTIAPDAANLVPTGEAALGFASGKRKDAGCLISVASAPAEFGTGGWLTAKLSWDGPTGSATAAGAALRQVIESAHISREWYAGGRARTALTDALTAAHQATTHLPATGDLTLPTQPLLSLLASGEAVTCIMRLPVTSAPLLRKAAGESTALTLPELSTSWWQKFQGFSDKQ